MKNLRALSLFSGAGGMDIGVRKAGFEILSEIELDQYCCQTLRAACERENRKTLVIENDIREIAPQELMKKFSLKPRELDLLFGGPPCQPFSLAGKQKSLNDIRGPLLFEIIRFAETFKPKVIFLEQVKGLLSAKGKDGKKRRCISNLPRRIGTVTLHPEMAGLPRRRLRRSAITRACFSNCDLWQKWFYVSRTDAHAERINK
jgi:DNA (cytosine-5)-methyltransferase 1